MSDSYWFAKSIIETVDVQKQVADLHDKYSRFDQVWEGLTWTLARRAHTLGIPFRGYRIYKHSGVSWGSQTPALTLLFEVKEHEIEIVSVRVSDPECNLDDFDF